MKKRICLAVCLALVATTLCACQSAAPAAKGPNAGRTEGFYSTSVKYTAENDGAQAYVEIAQRSAELFALLEENAGAFVMDAYNYQSIDDAGTMLYTQNTLSLPVETDPGGHCIRVSGNYFKYNPIETADGAAIESRMDTGDKVLNLLVPQQYGPQEEDIVEAYRQLFYFEKVEVDNVHREEMGQPLSDIAPEELGVNIIYVKDGQEYFTYRSDLASATGNVITDPIVVLYTGNIHVSYAHSFMTQFVHFQSEEATPEAAYEAILPYVRQVGAEESFQKVNRTGE